MGNQVAAFTIVQNEPIWLPHWVEYYGSQLGYKNLFVLDHGSCRREGLNDVAVRGGTVVPVHRSVSFDHQWLRKTVERFQAFLLQSYQTVLFAEADEFLLTTHAGGLEGFMAGNDWGFYGRTECVRARGFNVVHYTAEEEPLQFDWPLLAQREWWHPSRLYSKTLIARAPLWFTSGFHDLVGGGGDLIPHPQLYLAHLHRADFDYAWRKTVESAARPWSPADVAAGYGYQNRITDEGKFRDWFYLDEDVNNPRELIPDELKSLV